MFLEVCIDMYVLISMVLSGGGGGEGAKEGGRESCFPLNCVNPPQPPVSIHIRSLLSLIRPITSVMAVIWDHLNKSNK